MNKKRRKSSFKKIAFVVTTLMLATAGTAAWFLESAAMPPRAMGPWLEQRSRDYQLGALGAWAAQEMERLDRAGGIAGLPPMRIGAQAGSLSQAPLRFVPAALGPDDPAAAIGASVQPSGGGMVPVSDAETAIHAIEKAHAGDVVTFAPGTYRFTGRPYIASSSASGVTVRAQQPGTVFIEMELPSGFLVTSPGWTFENLHIRGACTPAAACRHAFHITGRGTGFVARNNSVVDFNAHFHVNGNAGSFPDKGLIEHNTISNTAPRTGKDAVAPVDIVAASEWTVRANVISDFAHADAAGRGYGVSLAGGGSGNRVARNAIVCEHRLRGAGGLRVGVVAGAVPTKPADCRDKRCAADQAGAVIESNIVAACSGDGIHLDRAAASTIAHNTVLDTAGVTVASRAGSADVEGNIVDGRIHAAGGATLRAGDNLDTGVTRLFTGAHPLRDLYAAPARLDLRWLAEAPRRADGGAGAGGADLCGTPRPARAAYGAFEDFSACLLR